MTRMKYGRQYLRMLAAVIGIFCFFPALVTPVLAAGSSAVSSGKTGNMALVYGAVAMLSVLLALTYILWEKRKEKHLTLLYLFVAIANCGYFLLSVSQTLTGAMWANRISYFGCAYLVLLMLYIIMDVCQFVPKRWLNIALVTITTAAFLLAACGHWLGLYYKAVDIVVINGMTKLVKEYGPLHVLYPVYILSYFVFMISVILYTANRRKLSSPKYAVFLACVVLMNICVWGVEQAIDIDFEFLCVSYIVTEVMLLLIHSMLRDYGILQPGGILLSAQMLQQIRTSPGALPPEMEDLFDGFASRVETLTPAERRILQYYIDGHDIGEIPDLAYVSIHTVKKHNRSIYQKLEVASRDELMLYLELFRCCGRLEELMSGTMDTL